MSRLQGPMSFGSWQTSGLELLVDDLIDKKISGPVAINTTIVLITSITATLLI